jgi:hypothetical protein
LKFSTISIEGFIKPLILKRKGARGGKSLTFLVKRVEGPSSLALLKSRGQRRYSRQRRQRRGKKRNYGLRERLSKLLKSSKRSRRKLNGLYRGRIVIGKHRRKRPRKQQRFRHGRSYERHRELRNSWLWRIRRLQNGLLYARRALNHYLL